MFFRTKPWRSRAPFSGARRRGRYGDAPSAVGPTDADTTGLNEPAPAPLGGTDRAIGHPSAACLTAARIDESGLLAFRRFQTSDRLSPLRQQPSPARTAPLGSGRRTA